LIIIGYLEHLNSSQRRPGEHLCGEGTFDKIWSPCGVHELKYTEGRINECTYNYMYNFTSALYYISN